MRYITASLGFIVCVASLPAFADDTYQRNTGVSINTNSLAIRHSLSESNLVFAGISSGYSHSDASFSDGNAKSISNNNGLSLGIRHFLSVEKLSKFVETVLSIGYGEGRDSFGNTGYSAHASLSALYGVEYFLTSNLSIEGMAGVGIGYSKSSSAMSKDISKQFSLPVASTAITYYW